MSLYAHISSKDDVPNQRGYFMELLQRRTDAFGGVSPEGVTTFRYLVAGGLFMRFVKTMDKKQGKWEATYMPTEEHAQQLLSEHVAIDNQNGTHVATYKVTEVTVGLTEKDLVNMERKYNKGIDARWRATHWIRHHIGVPAIIGTDVIMEGGVD